MDYIVGWPVAPLRSPEVIKLSRHAAIGLRLPSAWRGVCRQNISDIRFGKLREYLAHLV
jgi:hypothetical protein